MRNKNTIKQALLLASLLPFLAFSVVLANHGAEDSMEKEEDHSVYENNRRSPEDVLKMREDRESMRMERKEMRMESIKTRRGARALVIKTVMEMQIARATKAFDRLSLILDKIEAKSEDMPAGADMAQADALIARAKTQETALKAALDKAQDDFDKLLATKVEETTDEEASTVKPVEDAKNAVKLFMTTMKDIKKKLIEFHKTQHEAVKVMRAAVKAVETEEEEEETETPSPAPTPTPTPNPTN